MPVCFIISRCSADYIVSRPYLGDMSILHCERCWTYLFTSSSDSLRRLSINGKFCSKVAILPFPSYLSAIRKILMFNRIGGTKIIGWMENEDLSWYPAEVERGIAVNTIHTLQDALWAIDGHDHTLAERSCKIHCFTDYNQPELYSSCKMQMVFYQVLRTLSVWRNYTAMILLRSCLFSQLKRHLYSLCKGCIIVISGSTLPTAWRLFQTMYEDRQNQAQGKVLGFAHSYLS